MTATVYIGETGRLSDIAGRGAGHPVFGFLFDLGTVAALTGFGTDALAAVERLCVSVDPGGDRLAVERLADDAPDDTRLRERLESQAASDAVCVVLTDEPPGQLPPLVIVCGARVPAMGVTEECGPERMRATLAHLAGRPEPDAESLFTEPELPGYTMEDQLNERLRQLYGE